MSSANAGIGRVDVVGVALGQRTIPYQQGWELQRQVHSDVVAGRRGDTLLLLEHDEVFTAGSRTQPEDRPVDGSEVIDVDRGGRITWHGPGQLVGYPILRLPHPMDVVAHVRALESLLISVCEDFGVDAIPIEGRSGVWVADATGPGSAGPASKIAAVGIRVTQGVTMHGFALNCDCDLTWSQRIVPCGIPDAGVTSLAQMSGRDIDVMTAASLLSERLTGSPVVPQYLPSNGPHVA